MIQKRINKNSRERIISRLRDPEPHLWEDSWLDEVPEGQVFPSVDDLLTSFLHELVAIGGEVVMENGENALLTELKKIIIQRNTGILTTSDELLQKKLLQHGLEVSYFNPDKDIEVGITTCEALIALTGSVMVSSLGGSGRRMNVFPPVHIVMAGKSQLVASISDGFHQVETKRKIQPSLISVITGPSRTADIEKTLVMGAHGPRELIVLIDLES